MLSKQFVLGFYDFGIEMSHLNPLIYKRIGMLPLSYVLDKGSSICYPLFSSLQFSHCSSHQIDLKSQLLLNSYQFIQTSQMSLSNSLKSNQNQRHRYSSRLPVSDKQPRKPLYPRHEIQNIIQNIHTFTPSIQPSTSPLTCLTLPWWWTSACSRI